MQVVARAVLKAAGGGDVVDEAENGEVAVQRVRDAAAPYDLVLMDKQMPVMDGHEVRSSIDLSLTRRMDGWMDG